MVQVFTIHLLILRYEVSQSLPGIGRSTPVVAPPLMTLLLLLLDSRFLVSLPNISPCVNVPAGSGSHDQRQLARLLAGSQPFLPR